MKGELLEITAENIRAGDFLCPLPGPHRIRAHLDVITTTAQPRCVVTGAVLFSAPDSGLREPNDVLHPGSALGVVVE
jgi:hypothetical protein